jgi:hypothetical protein
VKKERKKKKRKQRKKKRERKKVTRSIMQPILSKSLGFLEWHGFGNTLDATYNGIFSYPVLPNHTNLAYQIQY